MIGRSSNLPNNEHNIKMFTKVRRRMNAHSENFNKEAENTIKYQTEVTELETTIADMKNTPEEINSK